MLASQFFGFQKWQDFSETHCTKGEPGSKTLLDSVNILIFW